MPPVKCLYLPKVEFGYPNSFGPVEFHDKPAVSRVKIVDVKGRKAPVQRCDVSTIRLIDWNAEGFKQFFLELWRERLGFVFLILKPDGIQAILLEIEAQAEIAACVIERNLQPIWLEQFNLCIGKYCLT